MQWLAPRFYSGHHRTPHSIPKHHLKELQHLWPDQTPHWQSEIKPLVQLLKHHGVFVLLLVWELLCQCLRDPVTQELSTKANMSGILKP